MGQPGLPQRLACDVGLAAPLLPPPAGGGGAIACAALTEPHWRWNESEGRGGAAAGALGAGRAGGRQQTGAAGAGGGAEPWWREDLCTVSRGHTGLPFLRVHPCMGAIERTSPANWVAPRPTNIAHHVERACDASAGHRSPCRERDSQSGGLRRPWDGRWG